MDDVAWMMCGGVGGDVAWMMCGGGGGVGGANHVRC